MIRDQVKKTTRKIYKVKNVLVFFSENLTVSLRVFNKRNDNKFPVSL